MTGYLARMDSPACVQSFGWQGGCVLDGLVDLSALPSHTHLRDAARRQLARYVINEKPVCENHVRNISDGHIYGIEGTLAFAALALVEPQQPLPELPLKFRAAHRGEEDVIPDSQHISSEGCYTVGYPMALFGRIRQDAALQQLALTQLRVRQSRLFEASHWCATGLAGQHRQIRRNQNLGWPSAPPHARRTSGRRLPGQRRR